MEKTQGFLTALKGEILRGLSPARLRAKSPDRRRKVAEGDPDPGSISPTGETLAPLIEGPEPDGGEIGGSKRTGSRIGSWFCGQLIGCPSTAFGDDGVGERSSVLRMMIGVMGAPLAPVYVSTTDPLPNLSIKNTAMYILQQYTAACGGQKALSSIKNTYAMGRLKMVASEFETATKVLKSRCGARTTECGGFVLWQMNPDMWYVELAVGGSKVHAGCNGKFVWRHTPWGSHTAKGPVRPLRRALQGLDPKTTTSMFAEATCIGEKSINGNECFILKLIADHETLKARSEPHTEIIRHSLLGYFSQRTGLLVQMEDSYLTRIQSDGGDVVYWETTATSFLDDYRPVEGVMVAHSGHSVVTLFRFGDTAMSHTKTRMEEAWTIEEVAFNVPGLLVDCFIPPRDLAETPISEGFEFYSREERGKSITGIESNRVWPSEVNM